MLDPVSRFGNALRNPIQMIRILLFTGGIIPVILGIFLILDSFIPKSRKGGEFSWAVEFLAGAIFLAAGLFILRLRRKE